MKLKKIVSQQSKLIRLQLIKFKIYKENQSMIEENFQYSELYLKKALQIIYNYHFHNKNIFFIGLPLKIQRNYSKLFFQTSHSFIPKLIKIDGIITNKDLRILNQIEQKPDLIVFFDKKIKYSVFKETVKLKIPVITITTNIKLNENVLYSIYSNFYYLNKRLNNLYIYLFTSILKKAKSK